MFNPNSSQHKMLNCYLLIIAVLYCMSDSAVQSKQNADSVALLTTEFVDRAAHAVWSTSDVIVTDDGSVQKNSQRALEKGPIVDAAVMVQSVLYYGVISAGLSRRDDVHGFGRAIGRKCVDQLQQIVTDISLRKLYAIKALDASGSPSGSFVWGNKAWLGSPQQCAHLNEAPRFALTANIPKSMDNHLIDTVAPMTMQFRMVFSNFSSRLQIDSMFSLKSLNRLGLCLPAACADTDVEQMVQHYWLAGGSHFLKTYDIVAGVVLVRSMEFANFSDQPTVRWIAGGLFGTLLLLIVFSQFGKCLSDHHPAQGFLRCFSLATGVQANTINESPNAISAINGIRPIICIWITIVHVAFYSMFAYDNLPELFQALEGIAIQPVFSAFVYVDCFFVMSGILLAYNFFKNPKKLEQFQSASVAFLVQTYAKTLLNRYLRLTPPLMFTVGLSHLLSLYIRESSAYFIDTEFDLYSTSTGIWRTLLYIQNMYPAAEMSLTWSWYLACDMQFYAIVLLLLIVYTKHPKMAKSIFVILLASMVAISFHVSLSANVTPRIDALFASLDTFYSPPWMRMHPYLVGVIIGYAMVRLQANKPQLSTAWVGTYWTLAVVVFVGSLFATYSKDVTAFMFAIAFSVGRLLLSAFWGSVVVMCFLGYGGGLQRFLSCSPLRHLNGVSYMMYLLNPVIIVFLNACQQSAVHYDLASIITKIVCVICLTYLAALLLGPLVETPFQRLSERYLMQRHCDLQPSTVDCKPTIAKPTVTA